MDMIGKVRRMHRRDNKSVREIARLTGLSRNTVAKWLEAPREGQPKYRREAQPSKLTAFHEALEQALKASPFKVLPKPQIGCAACNADRSRADVQRDPRPL